MGHPVDLPTSSRTSQNFVQNLFSPNKEDPIILKLAKGILIGPAMGVLCSTMLIVAYYSPLLLMACIKGSVVLPNLFNPAAALAISAVAIGVVAGPILNSLDLLQWTN